MMNEKDLEEYHNIGKDIKGMKKANKYNYLQGKQITDVDTGTRFYDFQGMRLPSVTTILQRQRIRSI